MRKADYKPQTKKEKKEGFLEFESAFLNRLDGRSSRGEDLLLQRFALEFKIKEKKKKK